MLLDNDAFLTQLTRLFENVKSNTKKIQLTMKRHTWQPKKLRNAEVAKELKNKELEKKGDDKEYPMVIRATCGKNKIQTVVNPSDSDKFYTAYSNILKVHMDSMKKREKKEKKKTDRKKKIRKAKATIA
ncbi:signal recognition particle, SRP9/SRP14 subunit [Gigaspora rosea]|uniref:Signal recognition particle subunit SRP14 n=1 Tax=Gigaspora rosea TaxID=44941 RepID=A0A397VXU3_9GLOM|nr:signal recognition particle, SRP9/SRP14 subunit [Gigaspora rosea]CAG8539634.1 19958_t:CDS:2 [Gigaspora rosea]